MAFNRRRQQQPRGSYWFAQSGTANDVPQSSVECPTPVSSRSSAGPENAAAAAAATNAAGFVGASNVSSTGSSSNPALSRDGYTPSASQYDGRPTVAAGDSGIGSMCHQLQRQHSPVLLGGAVSSALPPGELAVAHQSNNYQCLHPDQDLHHTPVASSGQSEHSATSAAATAARHTDHPTMFSGSLRPTSIASDSAIATSGRLQQNQQHNLSATRGEARERHEALYRRRMEELAAHNEHAQRIREEAEIDQRKRPNFEKQTLNELHRQQVDERRRALYEADLEWREAVLRRSHERDLKAEQYRKNRLSASVFDGANLHGQPASAMSSPARGVSDQGSSTEVGECLNTGLSCGGDGVESPVDDKEDHVAPLPSEVCRSVNGDVVHQHLVLRNSRRFPRMSASCFGSLWGSGALVQDDGDLMSRSMIVTSSAARRKTDLTPVTPSPWARGLSASASPNSRSATGTAGQSHQSRPQTAALSGGSSSQTPKRAVSMSRLDILAQPRRRFTMEDLKSRSHSAWRLNESQSPSHHGSSFRTAASGGGTMMAARSMSHLNTSQSPYPLPRLTRTTQMRQQQSAAKGHQAAVSSRSEQVSPTHQMTGPHHLRSRSQMSSDLSQSSVASSVGSPHAANMRPKTQGSTNRKVRPLSIAGSIPSSELDRKDKPSSQATPMKKPLKPVPPASSPEPQTTAVGSHASNRQQRSASPRKKEHSQMKEAQQQQQQPQTQLQQQQTVAVQSVLDDALTSEEMAIPTCSAAPVDEVPLLMTQSFTEGCMSIENRPAESRKTKTREEAMAEIAEARRKAREELERQAEEERRRKEEEAAARKAIQEKRRQIEEEARLKKLKEEEEKRRVEEESRKVEEERLRAEEEAKRLEEEKAKQETLERQKREEQERLERKKRVEEIMARTRKTRQGGENKESACASQTQQLGAGSATGSTTDLNGSSSTTPSPTRELSLQPSEKVLPNTIDALKSSVALRCSGPTSPVPSEPQLTPNDNQARIGMLNGHTTRDGMSCGEDLRQLDGGNDVFDPINEMPKAGLKVGSQAVHVEASSQQSQLVDAREPLSIDNSPHGPASADSGTGSADFNSNSTTAAVGSLHKSNVTSAPDGRPLAQHLLQQQQQQQQQSYTDNSAALGVSPNNNNNIILQSGQISSNASGNIIAPVLPGQTDAASAALIQTEVPLVQDLLS